MLTGSVRRVRLRGASTLSRQRHYAPLHSCVRRIILVRHGECEGNVDASTYARVADNQQKLTPWGREQSAKTGRNLRKVVGDESVRFYVSPYERSHETLRIMSDVLGADQFSVLEDPRLREQDWGNFQDLAHMSRQQKERKAFGVFYYRFTDGESGADVYDRVSSFMETLHRDSQRRPAENIVIVSHGTTLRMFLARWYHWPVSTLNKLHNFYNCQMVMMERSERGGQGGRVGASAPAFYAGGDATAGAATEERSRLLLTTVLGSDPPGPPPEDFWWERIVERKKTANPLIGL